ncbi:transposase [Bradyrhizobium sp. USDA 4451]
MMDSREVMLAADELFGDLPEQAKPPAEAGLPGAPRLREPQRDQIALRAVDIESLIGEDHPVRLIWSYVEELDLSELEDRIKARGDRPGHPATSPRLLLALWLYAASEGVGSARALERLCESHDAYRWLCGGVSVNYHLLADFRVGNADLLDRLLSEHLAALAKAGLVDLETLAQDGMRVRASAGAASFRREATLDKHLAQAEAVVEDLKREVDTRSDASNKRARAAKERAARERSARVKAAQTALAEIKQQRKEREESRGNGKTPKEPRASTTDAYARVMKMANGGFRPAYNVQVTSVAGEQIVVDTRICNIGSDRGLMRPMLERQRARPRRVAQGPSRRWRLWQCRGHRMGLCRGHRYLLSAHSIQARYRSLSTAARRRSGGVGLACANGERRGQGPIQVPVDLRVHPCPLAQLGPAAIDRARHRKGPCRRALVRPRQQHPARQPPLQSLNNGSSPNSNSNLPIAATNSRQKLRRSRIRHKLSG